MVAILLLVTIRSGSPIEGSCSRLDIREVRRLGTIMTGDPLCILFIFLSFSTVNHSGFRYDHATRLRDGWHRNYAPCPKKSDLTLINQL